MRDRERCNGAHGGRELHAYVCAYKVLGERAARRVERLEPSLSEVLTDGLLR
jgi:hypothetical protein